MEIHLKNNVQSDFVEEVDKLEGWYFRMLFFVRLVLLTLACRTNSTQEGETSLFLGHWQQRRSPGLDFYFSASSHRRLLRAPGHSALLMHYQ